MKKALLLILTALLVLAFFSPAAAEETKKKGMFGLRDTREEQADWIRYAVPVAEAFVVVPAALLPDNTQNLVVTDDEHFWPALAVIRDSQGLLATIFYNPEEQPANIGHWPMLPWGGSVPTADSYVHRMESNGDVTECGVLAAESIPWQGRRGMLITLTEPAYPGCPVLTKDGQLAGIIIAEWAEGNRRYLALPAEEIVNSLNVAVAHLSDMMNREEPPEGLTVSLDKNTVTIDWKEMTLPEKAAGEELYLVLADLGNNYLHYYPAEIQDRTMTLPLPPGRTYIVGVEATAQTPDSLPEHSVSFTIPQAERLTEYGFRPVLTAVAETPENGGQPVPVTEVTEEMLRSGRVYFYSHSAYEVTEQVEKTLLVTLTDPDGCNYVYESTWIYLPECMQEDIWQVSLQEVGLTAALDRNGYPAGIYRMAYYVGGDLADELEFELK